MSNKHGKKYIKALSLVEPELKYSVKEAVDLLEKTNTVKFDPSIEIHFNLWIDPRHADQIIRNTITLPNWNGKIPKIGAFTDAGDEKELLKLWATVAGWEDLVEKVNKWEIDFDIAIATPSMMRHLWKVARVLWPKGLMPNPKAWTVWPDLKAIIEELKAGKFEFKNDKQGNVHSVVGKLSLWSDKLIENIEYFIANVKEIRPSGVKNASSYIKNISVCNAMWPGIKVEF